MKMIKTILSIFLIALVGSCRQDKKNIQEQTPTPISVRGVCKIVPTEEILTLSFPVGGKVDQILVSENDTVTISQALVGLDLSIDRQNLSLAEAKVKTQQAKIQATKARLQEEKEKLNNLQRDYERTQRLYQQGAETGQEMDHITTDLAVQKAVVERVNQELQESYHLLAENEQSVLLQQTQMNDRILFSPLSGKILEILVNKGEYVNAGESVIKFQPEGGVIALCEIDELFANEVSVGQDASILSTGGIDTLGKGTVIFHGDYLKKKSLFYEEAGEAEDRRVLEVKIRLQDTLPILLNSKVECAIKTDH